MARNRRPFIRQEAVKDCKLIIIATEGSVTEKHYFDTLTSKKFYYNPKVHVEMIPNSEHKSSPSWILDNLKTFVEKYDISDDDLLFLTIDRDNWPSEALSDVARKCSQANISFIVTTPCFEFWILLHIVDYNLLNDEIQIAIRANNHVSQDRTYIEKLIIEKIGSYNKSSPNFEVIINNVHDAIKHAEKIPVDESLRWPETVGTKIPLIIKEILLIKS